MNLGNLRTMVRTYNPTAKKNAVSPSVLDLILNNGAKDVASKSICLPANTKFATVADKMEYDLSSILARFLIIDKPGVWYRESTTEDYRRLRPVTIKWLDERQPNWRDRDSSDPYWYYQHGNALGLVPAPDATISEGIWVYFGQAPESMTESAHFPFGFDSEITRLQPLSEAVIAYASWKVVKAMHEGQDAYRLGENEYKRTLDETKDEIDRRIDVEYGRKSRYRGRRIY